MKNQLLFSSLTGLILFVLSTELVCSEEIASVTQDAQFHGQSSGEASQAPNSITIFMSGDVMTGRGIDQVLPHPSDPVIHESFMKSAIGYVELAEPINEPIQKPVNFSYIWGDALAELERMQPDIRIINLETSVTTSNDYWWGKTVHYRMHPMNIPALTAAGIDFCALANNHILDWGYAGLTETLDTLQKADINYSGAGQSLQAAETPAVIEVAGKGRVIVFSYGLISSGIPVNWGATADKAGVNLLKNLSDETIQHIKAKVEAVKQARDIVVVSIHWGSNWGYWVPPEQTEFAHKLIDEARVDIIHGHSSHHVKGIEVYKEKLVIYGAGDFLNDYEGIGGYESFRGDLALMYFVSMDSETGKLVHLQLTPTQIKRLKVKRASEAGALWLRDTLNREGKKFGTRVEMSQDNSLVLKWD